MRKLRLDLDTIHVETFSVTREDGLGGTIRAYATAGDISCATACNTYCYCPTHEYRASCPGGECTSPYNDSADTFCPSGAACPGSGYDTCGAYCSDYTVCNQDTCVSCNGSCSCIC